MSTTKPAIEKAVYDKAVIDAWRTRRAGYLRSFNIRALVASLVGMSLLGLLAYKDVPWWPIATALFILSVAVSTMWAHHRYLRCPHCERRVRSANASPLLPQPTYCRHCLYWLESPYAGDQPDA